MNHMLSCVGGQVKYLVNYQLMKSDKGKLTAFVNFGKLRRSAPSRSKRQLFKIRYGS